MERRQQSESLRAVPLDSGDMQAWDGYVSAHDEATAYHYSGWRRVIERVFRRRTYYFAACDGSGDFRGVLPLVRLKSVFFGDFLVSMPYLNYGGLLADSLDAQTCLVERCTTLANELGVRHVELRHTRNMLDLPARTDRISMVLDLPAESETLFSALGSKVRAQIRRPRREGAEAEVGGAELVGCFYPIFAKKYRQLGVPVYPRRWFEAILDEFPESVRIALVRIQGKPVAGGIVISHGQRAEVAWAASEREFDRLGANMFLYWSMLEDAIERGFSTFDFGRTSEDSGTYRFKKQWGTRPVPLYWHYILGTGNELPRLNLDNPRYERMAMLWRRLPLRMTTMIGPRLVRNLP